MDRIPSTVRLNGYEHARSREVQEGVPRAILDRLGPEGIVITKHGKPVAKLIPIQTESAALIGNLAGKIRVRGDLLTPTS